MDKARTWLTTLALLALAGGVWANALRPADAVAAEPAVYEECFYLTMGTGLGKGGTMLVPFGKFIEDGEVERTFALRGWTPVSAAGTIFLMCR